MRSNRVLAAVALSVALITAGCGGDDAADPADDADDAAAADETSDDSADDATDDTADDAADGTADDVALTGDAEPVDICALFTADDFAAVYGAAPDGAGEPVVAQGSLLGGCSYTGPDGASVMIQARPASEWEGTVEMYGGAPAAGASMDTTFEESIGLLASFDGEGWFAHVMASQEPGVWDEAASVAIAEAMAAHL